MLPDHWSRIRALFNDALQQPDAERPAFLSRACPDDAALRAEVETLLVAHQRAEATRAFETPFLGARTTGQRDDERGPYAPMASHRAHGPTDTGLPGASR